MGHSFKFKPARDKHEDPVSDLDALESKSVTFRFQGVIHTFKPINTQTYFYIANAMDRLGALANKKELLTKDLVDAYTELFASCCDTIRRKQVGEMNLPQISALLQLLMDHSSGRVNPGPFEPSDPDKKKA